MKVEQLMMRDVKACRQEDMLNTAAQLMWENDCGCVPVLGTDGSGNVLGIVTDRDICMAAYTQGKRLIEIPVATAMAHKVISCRVGDDLKQAEHLMRQNKVRRLPVVDTYGRLQGIISLDDVASEAERERLAGQEKQSIEVAQTLAQICKPRIPRHLPIAV
jgi:CBS domain-containing protein